MVTVPLMKRSIALLVALNRHPSAMQNASGVHARKDARWCTPRGLIALCSLSFIGSSIASGSKRSSKISAKLQKDFEGFA